MDGVYLCVCVCTTFLYRSAGLTLRILLLHLVDNVLPPLCELLRLQDGLVDVLSSFICRSLEAKQCFRSKEMCSYVHITSCF